MYQSELEDFEREIKWHNRHLEAAGVESLKFISDGGIDNIGIYSLPARNTKWFNDFESAEAYCMSLYPNAYWETTGWQRNR
jgi:hypothetical protein